MIRVGNAASAAEFPDAAKTALHNAQLRRNVRHATDVIRGKRALVVGEMPDWQALRDCQKHFCVEVRSTPKCFCFQLPASRSQAEKTESRR